MQTLKPVIDVLRLTGRDLIEDRVLTHAGALAFYTSLSLPPIVILLVWSLGHLDHGAAAHLHREAATFMGPSGASLVQTILENSDRDLSLAGPSGWVGLFALLFSASGVFRQLQMALNRIWGVEARPGGGVTAWLRKRFLTFGLVGVMAFLAAVSLVGSTLLGSVDAFQGDHWLVKSGHFAASLVLFTLLFAAVFKWLPDVALKWRDVLGGAFVTAVLFAGGKYLIGLYLARRGIGHEYGAAGSAILLLFWAYASAAILFLGAELLQAWFRIRGRRIRPNRFAVREGDDTR